MLLRLQRINFYAFGRFSDAFGRFSDAFGRFRTLSDAFRMAFGGLSRAFGRLFAIVDGFSLSWTAFRRPPIPVFFFIFFGPEGHKKNALNNRIVLGGMFIPVFFFHFFFGPEGPKKKCMKQTLMLAERRIMLAERF